MRAYLHTIGELYFLIQAIFTILSVLFISSVTENVALILTEVDLQHSAIWTAGVYLMLLMQFLENKIAVDLTRADFVEAQEVGSRLLVCIKSRHLILCLFLH